MIEDCIDSIIRLKEGNKEIAFFYDPDADPKWRMDVGNTCQSCMLGEVDGEVSVEADSLSDCVDAMGDLLFRLKYAE